MAKIVTCQYSGLVFKSESGRQKSHPRVQELLKEADRRAGGARTKVVNGLAAARIEGDLTIDDVEAIASAIIAGAPLPPTKKQRRQAAYRREMAALDSIGRDNPDGEWLNGRWMD